MPADAQSDEIHWRRELSTEGRAAPWSARRKLDDAARAMVRAGALASRARAGFHGARYEQAADALLEETTFGAPGPEGTEGGRVLAARIPVAVGRTPAVALAGALLAAREALDLHAADGVMEPFDAAVERGVCQELLDALVQLLRGTDGVRIGIAWSAHPAPSGDCPPAFAPVRFTAGELPVLQRAARRYIREEPSVPVQLTGHVVRLRRAEGQGPGAVRIRVLEGAEVRQVRARLEEDAYRVAAHAHLAGVPLRVRGQLESRGGFRRVSGACEVEPAPEAGAEPAALERPLRDSLDAFVGMLAAGGTPGRSERP